MNRNSSLDDRIRAALVLGEGKLSAGRDLLAKVKKMLDEEKNMDRSIDMKSLFKRSKFKVSLVFIIVFVLVGGILGVSAATFLRTDKIDYPFVDDQQVLGKWQSVDFVSTASDFVPGQKQSDMDPWLKELAFVKDGTVLASINEGNGALAYTGQTWTKGLVINPNNKTASKYEITDIDGSTYMFIEWKSGDYIFREMEPNYYVLKKVDSNDYSDYQCGRITDKIDYPFVDDPQVMGKWSSVDFVDTIDKFDPERKNVLFDLYLTSLTFNNDGKMKFGTAKGEFSGDFTWTNGLVLDSYEKTASAYTIKEINGSVYMFFEWKSGDYTFRGMQPKYYVLKRD